MTVAAVVSIVLGIAVPSDVNSHENSGWIDGAAILLAVIIVAVVTVRFRDLPIGACIDPNRRLTSGAKTNSFVISTKRRKRHSQRSFVMVNE